ncbi:MULTISPECIES: flagellar motor switch protein FliN [Neobacillus]|uniref:Flagellar motor switch protein FliN n=1 Tax=Neobacillus rhizophilus TaxID=2833579 RepID=A0A942U549_9BACI|nr:flagellar motor switch protein FliN [Neobacillus rhizophilus]MBS4213037.1 flagellar motor switch protein FliN [Neobacillus rhizophilus]MBU8918253.1 flagellar motor switch protein FliN [Bacillus sp. FJAT-29953]
MSNEGKISREELEALLGDTEKETKPFIFQDLPDEPQKRETDDSVNLDLLMDISLELVVELGRTKKKINEILELTQGSIIELDRVSGEPVDVLINGKIVAKGEVVVIDDYFGIRITEILNKTIN